mmetsp:Transcript_17668/g.29856  ORF Transcript_17668/g.29856 Transcript_17668/m.29856 type:complete len:165 (+) Transcript_17668:793-1287(+)
MDKIDIIASQIVTNSESSINNSIDLKVKLNGERVVMEKALAEYKEDLLKVDQNIQVLEQKNKMIENSLKSQEEAGQVTLDNLDQLVKSSDPVSGHIIKLSSKYSALDECMTIVKKAYEKDVITLEEFLGQIRALALKQCKQLSKMEKIREHFEKPGEGQGQPSQ